MKPYLLLFSFLLASASAVADDFRSAAEDRVIFDAVALERIGSRAGLMNLDAPYWTPAEADIARIEKTLTAHLSHQGETGKRIASQLRLNAYRLQYIGVSRYDLFLDVVPYWRRKAVAINGICKHAASASNWRTAKADNDPC